MSYNATTSVLATLPAPTGAGLRLGDRVVRSTDGTVWTLTLLGATRTWVRADQAQLPAGIDAPTFTAGAPASFTVTVAGAVVDAQGAAIPGALVEIAVTGGAGNLNTSVPTVGTLRNRIDGVNSQSCVVLQASAAGLFSVPMVWSAATAATWLVSSGPLAVAVDATAFP